jgi:Cdc6-like AAA superfamily ATPase
LALLENMRDHRILLLGRTGTGKTALLHELATKHSDRVIPIRPSALALTYVANSTILNFFASLAAR